MKINASTQIGLLRHHKKSRFAAVTVMVCLSSGFIIQRFP
jgi:hypothetical protein